MDFREAIECARLRRGSSHSHSSGIGMYVAETFQAGADRVRRDRDRWVREDDAASTLLWYGCLIS